MFAKGASGNHVYVDMYGSEVEDYSGRRSTTRLDTWVFKKVEEFLNRAKTDAVLNQKLNQDKIEFFLHLLGLDTAFHTHKPYSVEYKENIRVVNAGIKRIEEMIEEFYQHDRKTAYVFTSDHGMTDWGSQGAGDKNETDTCLVAWGTGVRGPRLTTTAEHSSPASWRLGHLFRSDVSQADVAPLMASLIGVPVPVNSVIVASEELIALSLLGLNYYQNYYRCLLTCVTLPFLGWIAWLLHSLVGDDSSHKKSPSFLHIQHDEVY